MGYPPVLGALAKVCVLNKIAGVIEIKDAKVSTPGKASIFASKASAAAIQPKCGDDFRFTRSNFEDPCLLRLQKHYSIKPETRKVLPSYGSSRYRHELQVQRWTVSDVDEFHDVTVLQKASDQGRFRLRFKLLLTDFHLRFGCKACPSRLV
jgi:hypothetical protein